MPLSVGTKLGPYEILSIAGTGGMGEVYRARDTRLDRVVAIKLLTSAFSRDDDRLRRFELEARNIAALNHPNIIAIYDIGRHGDTPYLVTEFLEGDTLRQRLAAGPINLRKTVEYAQQIAHGLAAAHERGIVHRDLKPENVFLTKDGHVKLLDFGLAKSSASAAEAGSLEGATIASVTQAGMVMGTAGYMAPEQVRAAAVDHRADIFSFGAVLYEMLSGKKAFTGESSVETMNAILKEDPPELDLTTLKVSPGLDRIVRHCLEKNPGDRFQSARDLTFALGALSGSESSVSRVSAIQIGRHRRWSPWVPWAISALAIVAALAVLLRPAPAKVRQDFAIPVPGEISFVTLSPDGRMLAFVTPDENSGEGSLFVQEVGARTATHLVGTEGAIYPFWSPDNKYVAFFADSRLKKVPLSGGGPQVLATVGNPRGGTWGTKNVILYSPDAGGPIWRVNADGTDARVETNKVRDKADSSHRWALFLPDGENFLFWSGDFDERPNDTTSGIYVSSINSNEKKKLVSARSSAGYADGQLFYVDDKGALVSVAVDAINAKVKGQPRVVVDAVGRHPSTYWSSFTVAQKGTVVYQSATGAPISQLTWYDRTGKELGLVGDPGLIANPTLSPDGTQVTFDLADLRAKNVDVWIDDIQRGTARRFTFDPTEETTGVWSHDGKMIAYRAATQGGAVMLKKAQGLERESALFRSGNGDDVIPTSWSPDDKSILCSYQPASGGAGMVIIGLDGKKNPLILEKFVTSNGQISPDGKWVAYQSNESGEWEIYVTTFPTPGGKLQVSQGGGTEPRWRADGKEIFYIGQNAMLSAATVNSADTISTSRPKALFQAHGRGPVSSTDLFTYDVSRDGQRFLVNRYMKPAHVPPLNIILNATEGMKQ